MDTRTMHPETAPGWRELLENLYNQLDIAHEREKTARERELFLERLLAEERRELQRLRGTIRPRRVAALATPRGRSELHTQILAAIGKESAGLTRAQVEAAVGTSPLDGVLGGLCRRGHLRRVGKGLYALAGPEGD